MKKLLILCLALTFTMTACSDDEDVMKTNLEGMIDGIPFEAKSASYVEDSDNKLSVEVFNLAATNGACSLSITSDVSIFFTCENTTDKQNLFVDFSSFEGQTVTMFNPDGSNNIIITEGYIQILDKTSTSLEVEMQLTQDGDNFASGVFTAEFCD